MHIRMISEGSCNTEGWNNDAENSALPLHLIENLIFSQYHSLFFTVITQYTVISNQFKCLL